MVETTTLCHSLQMERPTCHTTDPRVGKPRAGMSMQRAAVILYVKYDDVSDVVFLKKDKKALHDFDHSAAHKVEAWMLTDASACL